MHIGRRRQRSFNLHLPRAMSATTGIVEITRTTLCPIIDFNVMIAANARQDVLQLPQSEHPLVQ
jgi:hypothetical protein